MHKQVKDIYFWLFYVGLFASLILSAVILIKFLSIAPLIHPEKVSNLNFLWDKNIPDYKKLFSSCTIDACIGRVRPLNYTLEFIDAVYLESLFKATGYVTWKPLSKILLIIFCPIIFFLSNKKYLVSSILVSALFFSSFQFISDFYNYFRPGKEFSLLLLIPAISIIFSRDFRDFSGSKIVTALLITACMLDEQVIFFVFFLSVIYYFFGRGSKVNNSFNKTLLMVLIVYLVVIFSEGTAPGVTFNYLKNDSYSSFENILTRLGWFFKHSPSIFFEAIYFQSLGNKVIAIFLCLALFITIISGVFVKYFQISILNTNKIIKNYYSLIKSTEASIFNIVVLFGSILFIWTISSILHPGIVFGVKQGLAYYMLIPSFLFAYIIYIILSSYFEKYFNSIYFLAIFPMIFFLIIYFNFRAINRELIWIPGVYIDAKNHIQNHKRYEFHSWQAGAIFTAIANTDCDYSAFKPNDIEIKLYAEKVCSFIGKNAKIK